MQTVLDTLSALRWDIVIILGATGIIMALLSSLVGMRQKVEIPLWWLLYAVWIVVVILMQLESVFWTILMASLAAGILHAITQSILLDRYIKNNPWYADKMTGPKSKMRMMFLIMGIIIGAGFGAIVGGIALIFS